MRRLLVVGVLALGLLPGLALAEGVFVLHATTASFSGCGGLDERSVQCGQINNEPTATRDLFVWVLVTNFSGVDGISGAQFGIEYEGSMNVQLWNLCTGGAQIPQIGWPASGSGQAVTWAGACYPMSGSRAFAKAGFFLVGAGSTGRMRITRDPRIDQLALTDCDTSYQIGCEYNGSLAIGGGTAYLSDDCQCREPVIESTWASIKDNFRNP